MADVEVRKSPVMDPHADEYSIEMYIDYYNNYGICTVVEDGHVAGFYRVRKKEKDG